MSKKNWLILFSWWFLFSGLWGVFRLTNPPETLSELVAKPIIWLGITWLFFSLKLIPVQVITDLKQRFLTTKPFFITFVSPLLFIVVYFMIINLRLLKVPELAIVTIGLAIVVNFATGIVEEITYRGVLYVWLLQTKNELLAFGLVQLLFLLGHLPILILNSESLATSFTHAFFIVLLGSIHTLIFRLTKSLYASCLTHGVWNTLVYLVLLA